MALDKSGEACEGSVDSENSSEPCCLPAAWQRAGGSFGAILGRALSYGPGLRRVNGFLLQWAISELLSARE